MSKNIKSKKDILLAVLGSVLIIVAIDLTPLGGNTRVYTEWVLCKGNMPVQNDQVIEGEVKHYIRTPKFALLRGWPKYFCTPRDAELAGYSASPTSYEFPHLTKEERDSGLGK